MRVSLTVVDPEVDERIDVVLEADGSTPLQDVVDAVAALTRGRPTRRAVAPVGGGPVGGALVGPTGAGGSGGPPGAAGARILSLAGRRPRAATPDATPAYVLGVPLDPVQALAGSPVREGCVLSLGDPRGCMPPEPSGVLDVRVTGGPGAGVVHRLEVGEWGMGGSPEAAVRVEDPRVPDEVARLLVAPDGGCRLVLAAHHSGSEPLQLEGEPVEGEVEWPAGARLRVGAVLLEVGPVTAADAAVHPGEDGVGLDLNRPPRLLPPLRQTRFRLPREPVAPRRGSLPLLVMIAPLVLSVAMAVLLKVWYYLLLGLLSPVTMLGSWFADRRSGKRNHRKDMQEFRERTAKVEAEAREALQQEVLARRDEAPDPGTVLLVATGPRARLWERRRSDPDHLVVRVGTADLPSQVQLENADADQEHHRFTAWTAPQVPVTVPLHEAGVLGIAGRGGLPRRLAGWAVVQLAVLQSPRDVRFVVLTEPDAWWDWEWVRWLPHLRPGDDGDAQVLVGADPEAVLRRIGELGAVLAARQKALSDSHRAAMTFRDPDLVVVLDGARRLRSLPGVVALLTEGPAVGIRVICLDADERLLPQECSAVVSETATGLRVRRQRADVVEDVRPDLVDPAYCERVARCLAPLRDVGDAGEGSGLPGSVRLLDVLGLEPPRAEAVAAGWALGGRTTQAVVGAGLDGPLALDLSADGPHALIAGTTGAGKSELLQTLVAALAVANRPDAMTFVLVDYKGGSAFKDCVRLPHTVGMVTDLDAHLVERALTSLSAELKRREHVLAAAGAKDLEDYVDLAARSTRLPPVPRLVLVIDEFASLARELPEFVTGLVNVAQRGRSLGIHLVLATQRPSGVVSPEIRANTNLRIALRVTDTTESSDVIEAPDAARISRGTPGRGFARLGHATLVPFQAARVGGRRPGAPVRQGAEAGPRPWVQELPWSALGRPPSAPPREREETSAQDTDLAALVEAVQGAAQVAGVPPQHSPWLPALPEQLLMADLPQPVPVPGASDADPPPVAWALQDMPASQEQRPLVLDLSRFGHLYVVGGARSGRSQALRAIAGALAWRVAPSDVHLYGIDCGNGALLPLNGLPHCGAVVQRTQVERAQRLLARLTAEVGRRQEVLGQGGFAGVAEQRRAVPPGERLPHLVVLLDRWEGFVGSLGEVDGGTLVDQVLALLREGASAGVHLVLAGDRQLLSGRIASLGEDKLVLRMPDRTDVSLAGLQARQLPEVIPDGRAFRAETGIETQIALLDADPSGAAQAAALERIGAAAAERHPPVPGAPRPFRVDVLPGRLGFDQAWALRAGGPSAPPRPLWGLVGVGGDELTALGADLQGSAATFLVAGPPKSGRSSVLLAMTASFVLGGAEVVLVTPRTSPLRSLAGERGVRAVLTGDDVTEEELRPLLEADGPAVVVMDDAELLRDCRAGEYLRELVRTGGDRGRGLVLAGNADQVCSGFSGWQVDLRRNRHGALLCPQGITDGDLIGIRLPRSSVGGQIQPGRALLHDGSGELVTVQVPVPPAR